MIRATFLICAVALMSCDDDPEPDVPPEPEVFNFRYLSVEVTSAIEARDIVQITFNADDLKEYSYALNQMGSRRINCSSTTFLDTDDELVSQDDNSVSFKTDDDVIFDVVDLNGNIARFTPSITGATSVAIHNAGVTLTDDELSTYVTEVTRRVNFMPNQAFEVH